MPLNAALLFLLQNLGHGKRSVMVSVKQMLRWENTVLPILLEEKLLVEAELAKSLPCKCVEKDCLMSVVSSDLCDEVTGKVVGATSFGICGKSHSFIGILTEFEQHYLKQWQLTNEMLIAWLTKYLRLEPPKEANRAGVIQIGTATLDGESYALALGSAEELVLLVNGDAVPMAKIFQVSEGGAIEVVTDLIEAHKSQKVIDIEPTSPKKSTSAKRQVRKEETQKLHAAWQKEYKKLRQQYPNKSKYSNSWIAIQIAKLPIAQGLHKDTIRKNMVL